MYIVSIYVTHHIAYWSWKTVSNITNNIFFYCCTVHVAIIIV